MFDSRRVLADTNLRQDRWETGETLWGNPVADDPMPRIFAGRREGLGCYLGLPKAKGAPFGRKGPAVKEIGLPPQHKGPFTG